MADETPIAGGLASAPARTLGTRLSTWAERHAQVAVASVGRLGSRPIATLLVWAVIGMALTLPALLQVAVRNLAAAAPGQERAYVLNVFLKPSIGATEARQVADRLGARDDIAAVELVTPDEALAEFRVRSGFGEALDALTENPLPATLLLTPSPANATPAGMAELRDQLQRLREVDQVSADTQWAERLQALLAAASRVADGMALLLAVAVLLVVGQVVRADIETRRAEIEVTKLLGATDGFVRRPFLYTGLLYGLGGGLVALLLVAGSVAWLAPAVTRVAALYGSRFELLGLPGQTAFLLVAGGAALGWAGSWVAATWRLRQIEPSV